MILGSIRNICNGNGFNGLLSLGFDNHLGEMNNDQISISKIQPKAGRRKNTEVLGRKQYI